MRHFFARLLARWRRIVAPGEAPGDAGAAIPGAPAPAGMMNTDGPPMLDCDSVMRQLWDYLDHELTPDRAAGIRAHLDLCQRCYPQYEFERSFLDAVAGSARQHSNLERLRRQLMVALEAQGLREA